MVTVGITGHRNLPTESAEQIPTRLRAELAAFDPGELVGVTCLADGADTLFARAILARGGALQVIVPAQQYRDALPPGHHVDYVESTPESYVAASMLMLSLVAEP